MFVKKLASLSLALALVYSISFPARAELLKNFKADGSIEIRSFGIDNGKDLDSQTDDYRNDTRTRLMLGGSFDLLDDVHARVSLVKNNRRYGDNGTGSGESLNDVQSAVTVDNAYVKVDKVFGHVDLSMGRQYYGRSDDLVIYFGANDDADLTVNSLDIFRADADINGWAKIQAIAGKPTRQNNVTLSETNSDEDIFGGEISTDKVIPKGNLAAYYYTDEIKKRALPLHVGNDTQNVYGLRAAGDILMGLSYQAEGIANSGRNELSATDRPAYKGSAYLLGLKWANEIAVPLRASAEFGRGSRDFRAVSAGKRFGIIWGRFSGAGYPASIGRDQSTGLQNLKVADVKVGVDPIKKLGVDLGWYRFQYDDNQATGINNPGNSSAATEYDLIVSWKHSDNVMFEVNAASLQVGQGLNPGTANYSPVTEISGDVKIKF